MTKPGRRTTLEISLLPGRYRPAKLVLFREAVQAGCGTVRYRQSCGPSGRKPIMAGVWMKGETSGPPASRSSTRTAGSAERRVGQDAAGGAGAHDHVVVAHSITSSARRSSEEGMVRPRAFAVFRLTVR